MRDHWDDFGIKAPLHTLDFGGKNSVEYTCISLTLALDLRQPFKRNWLMTEDSLLGITVRAGRCTVIVQYSSEQELSLALYPLSFCKHHQLQYDRSASRFLRRRSKSVTIYPR